MVPRTEAVRRKRRHGVLVIWLFDCVGSLKCLRIFCDFMIFYVDWFWAIETIELGHFIDFVNLRRVVFLRFLCQPSLSLCYIDGPKGSPHGLPQVIACCLPSLCFVPSLGKGRSEQRLFLRSQMEQRQVETEETWQKRWEESDEEPNLNNLNIYICMYVYPRNYPNMGIGQTGCSKILDETRMVLIYGLMPNMTKISRLVGLMFWTIPRGYGYQL